MLKMKLIKIIKIQREVNKDDLTYKTGNNKKDKLYDFQKFKTIKPFGIRTYNGELTLEDALEGHINLKKKQY